MANVQNKQVILRKIVFMALIVMSGAFLLVSEITAQEEEGRTYSLSVHYSTGKVNRLDEVTSHKLIREENTTFMSVILKDGRRFLFTVDDRDFEFSKELSQIIEREEQAKKQ